MSIQRGNLYSKMLILRYGIAVYGFTQILDNETHSNIPALESFYFTSSVDENAVILLLITQHSGVNAGKKKIWKNLKQIMGLERGLPWKQDDPTCKDGFSGLSDRY